LELRTEIEIAAPPARVWEVLTDFSTYHEWNPFITRIGGDLAVGGTLDVTVSPPESDDFSFHPEVVVCDGPRELRWRGKLWLRGLLDGEHFFQCHEAEGGSTRFVHAENFEGLLLKFVGARLQHVARGFVYMNLALKRHVER
jgi:hypothetical protein